LSPKGSTRPQRASSAASLKKVVSDRRASLDEEEVKKATRILVRKEFEREANVPVEPFPPDSSAVEDSPRLRVVILDPTQEWNDDGALRTGIAEWTKLRGKSPRLYPASLGVVREKTGPRAARQNRELARVAAGANGDCQRRSRRRFR
jgi:hypothetical protein